MHEHVQILRILMRSVLTRSKKSLLFQSLKLVSAPFDRRLAQPAAHHVGNSQDLTFLGALTAAVHLPSRDLFASNEKHRHLVDSAYLECQPSLFLVDRSYDRCSHRRQ